MDDPPPHLDQHPRWAAILGQWGPWIVDGPMGTPLADKGWINSPTPLANLERPDWVAAIHQQWRQAGATVHRTNTFVLTAHIGSDEGWALDALRAGIRLARESTGPDGLVLISLGPVPPGQMPPDRPLGPRWRPTLDLADGLIWETWSHPNLVPWADWLNPDRALPQIVSWTFRPNPDLGPFQTYGNLDPPTCASLSRQAGAVAAGFNCGLQPTPEEIAHLVSLWQSAWAGPVWCCPAGPGTDGPDPLALWETWPAKERLLVGGCCGTTWKDGIFGKLGNNP